MLKCLLCQRWQAFAAAPLLIAAATLAVPGLVGCREQTGTGTVASTTTARLSASSKQGDSSGAAVDDLEWPEAVRAVRWSPRADWLVALHRDGVTALRTADWSVQETLRAGSDELTGIALSATTLAVGRMKVMELWSPNLERLDGRIATLGTVPIGFVEGGRRVMGLQSGERGGAMLLWDVASRKLVARVRRSKEIHGLLGLDARGTYAATFSDALYLWKLPAWSRAWSRATPSAARRARFVAGTPRLLTVHQDGTVVEWDADTGEQRWSGCCYADATGAGRFLLLSSDQALSVLSTATHQPMSRAPRLGTPAIPLQIELAPSGRFLAEVSLEGRLSIWALDETGKLERAAGPAKSPATFRREP